MKILIWVLGYAVMTLLALLTHYGLYFCGAFDKVNFSWLIDTLYLVAWIRASVELCRVWDSHKMGKCSSAIPVSCLREAEKYRGRTTELNAFIRSCLKSKKITKEQAKYLEKEYSKPSEY